MADYVIEQRQPASYQGQTPRRGNVGWNGQLGVHTSEGAPDMTPPDLGAEGLTTFILNRPDPGSYHTPLDADSIVQFANPVTWETAHIAARDITCTFPLNWSTAGLCFSYKAHLWGTNVGYEERLIDNGGRAAATMLLAWAKGDTAKALTACVWLTREQVGPNGPPGFFEHGMMQRSEVQCGKTVGYRSDAWFDHPDCNIYRERLLTSTRHYLGDSSASPQRKVPTKMLDTCKRANGQLAWADIGGDGKVYYGFHDGQAVRFHKMCANAVEFAPSNDPGIFDQVSIIERADGKLEITAWHTYFGFQGSYYTIEGAEQWTSWARTPMVVFG